MRKSTVNDEVMTTSEAAERLGVALRTVQLWVESGALPAWKTAGGHRRIARTAVEKLMRERRLAIDGNRPRPEDNTPFRVLLVEDDPDMLRLLTLVIKNWGLALEIQTATNGFEALLRIGEQCPHMLITDLLMPGMDGFQMLHSLRQIGQVLETLEIVVVTALEAPDIESRGGLPDGVRVFSKPVDFAKLEALVRDRASTAATRQRTTAVPALDERSKARVRSVP